MLVVFNFSISSLVFSSRKSVMTENAPINIIDRQRQFSEVERGMNTAFMGVF